MSFVKSRENGATFAKSIIKSIVALHSWECARDLVIRDVGRSLFPPDGKDLSNIRHQIFLALSGSLIREIWGRLDEYHPEYLREVGEMI